MTSTPLADLDNLQESKDAIRHTRALSRVALIRIRRELHTLRVAASRGTPGTEPEIARLLLERTRHRQIRAAASAKLRLVRRSYNRIDKLVAPLREPL